MERGRGPSPIEGSGLAAEYGGAGHVLVSGSSGIPVADRRFPACRPQRLGLGFPGRALLPPFLLGFREPRAPADGFTGSRAPPLLVASAGPLEGVTPRAGGLGSTAWRPAVRGAPGPRLSGARPA